MSELAEKLAGKFIVIDGPDGSGKSTQVRLLAAWLGGEGVDVCVTHDPGGTAIGDEIRRILLDKSHERMSVECELMLYMASRAQLVREVIRPALEAGECVLCDRYISSTIAYQGAGGADTDAVRTVAEIAVGGLWPDLTIILDVPVEVGLERIAERNGGQAALLDRMESKDPNFHRKVRELFRAQVAEAPGRFAVVDGTADAEQTQQQLRKVISGWKTE